MENDRRRYELDGPPWGSYVDRDEAYLRGQARSVGSGLLGGWSQAGFGGSIDAKHRAEDEVREAIRELIHGRLPDHTIRR